MEKKSNVRLTFTLTINTFFMKHVAKDIWMWLNGWWLMLKKWGAPSIFMHHLHHLTVCMLMKMLLSDGYDCAFRQACKYDGKPNVVQWLCSIEPLYSYAQTDGEIILHVTKTWHTHIKMFAEY